MYDCAYRRWHQYSSRNCWFSVINIQSNLDNGILFSFSENTPLSGFNCIILFKVVQMEYGHWRDETDRLLQTAPIIVSISVRRYQPIHIMHWMHSRLPDI
jgi:hypothetical protein